MKMLPIDGAITIFARRLVEGTPVEGQSNLGRSGKEATPAQHGVMRVPSGGSRLSGVLVRMVIQWASSQLRFGKMILPSVNVWPAANSIVSPQVAASTAV